MKRYRSQNERSKHPGRTIQSLFAPQEAIVEHYLTLNCAPNRKAPDRPKEALGAEGVCCNF